MTRPINRSAVLIVDDDDHIRRLLSTVMRREGYDVDTAENGQEALEQIARRGYGAVLLDLMMPEVSGYEVLRQLESRGERECVIIISAVAKDSLERLRGNVAAVVGKPFELTTILETTRSCIDKAWSEEK